MTQEHPYAGQLDDTGDIVVTFRQTATGWVGTCSEVPTLYVEEPTLEAARAATYLEVDGSCGSGTCCAGSFDVREVVLPGDPQAVA